MTDQPELDGMPERLMKGTVSGSFLILDDEVAATLALEDVVEIQARFIVTKAGTELRDGSPAPFVSLKLDETAIEPGVRKVE